MSCFMNDSTSFDNGWIGFFKHRSMTNIDTFFYEKIDPSWCCTYGLINVFEVRWGQQFTQIPVCRKSFISRPFKHPHFKPGCDDDRCSKDKAGHWSSGDYVRYLKGSFYQINKPKASLYVWLLKYQ